MKYSAFRQALSGAFVTVLALSYALFPGPALAQTSDVGVSGRIVVRTCDFASSYQPTQDLGRLSLQALARLGVGQAEPSAHDFSIDLNCEAGAKVNATFADSQQPGVPSAFLGPTAESTTKGVGIQLFRGTNDAPISLGTGTPPWEVTHDAPGGPLRIPLRARYYRFASDIDAGKLTTLAMFTLTYL
ncbi:fimbrial protein [Dyella sp.]|uniref:fimbrial protein n=1 Tax=Dyella sp. TaxID=1869338 RepID=UPI002ED5B6D6